MPGLVALVKEGCFDADNRNAVNAAIAATPGLVGTAVNGTIPFGNYTTGGTVVTLLPAGHAAGTYRLSISAVVTTTFVTAANVGHTLGWTDDQGARTQVNTLGALTAGTNSLVTIPVRSTGAAAITVTEIAGTSNASAGAMALTVTVERLA